MISDDTIKTHLNKHNLTLHTNTTTGRTVHTTKSFKRGDIVFYDTSYAHILHPRYVKSHCDYCMQTAQNIDSNHPDNISDTVQLTRCSQCKLVYYCSKSCQTQAWKQYHKIECKLLGQNVKDILTIPSDSLCDLLLCCRILRKMHKDNTVTPVTMQQSHYQYTVDIFDAIANHVDPKTLPQYSDTESQYNKITDIIDYKQIAYQLTGNREIARVALSIPALIHNTTREHIENLLCIMQCNNFAVADDLLIERGAGVYLYGSLLNSSCEPNTTITYETMTIDNIEYKHVQVFRALTDIPTDTEITHTYTDIAAVTPTRRKTLAQKYYYKCECVRCTLPYEQSNDRYLHGNVDGTKTILCSAHEQHKHNTDDTIETELQTADDKQTEAESSAMNNNSPSAAQQELQLMLQAYDIRSKHLHQIHIRNIQTAALVMNAALLVQNYIVATDACKQLCDKYRIVYQPLDQSKTYHPLLGLQLYTLGSLYEQIGQTPQAQDTLHESMNILSVTHGSNSRLVQQLSQHVDKLKQTLKT